MDHCQFIFCSPIINDVFACIYNIKYDQMSSTATMRFDLYTMDIIALNCVTRYKIQNVRFEFMDKIYIAKFDNWRFVDDYFNSTNATTKFLEITLRNIREERAYE